MPFYLFKFLGYIQAVEFLKCQQITITKRILRFMKAVVSRIATFSSFKPEVYQGPPFQEVWNNHQKYMFPFYKPLYKTPFFAVQGRGQYLFDDKGRQYLDLCAGISTVNVGHCHPRLTKVFNEQTEKLMHISPIYMHEYQGQYCKALCEELGEGFDTVFLCNSGSEANDFALNIARLFTKSEKIYSLRNAYHGLAGNSISLTNIKSWNSNIPKPVATEKMAMPNFYRSSHNTDSLIYDAEELMNCTSNGKIAGSWIEPVMGAGGIYPMPDGYFKRLAEVTRRYGGLVVSDEVQTGFGRIGKDKWGFKAHDVKPDIVITAKAIANGYPMAAVITRKEIMSSINYAYFNTFGGGPVQCRLGLEVLQILKDEKLPENAENIGNYLLQEFKRIGKNHPKIGDVRGRGMMIALEFVKTKECKTPDPETTLNVLDDMKNNGILFAKAGQNIIRVVGTLCLNMEDAKQTVQTLEHVVSKYK